MSVPPLLNDTMQRPAWGGQGVHASADCRVLHQGRGMMRLHPGVDHQRTATSPVLIGYERFYSVNIRGRIAGGKCYPEKIFQVAGGKFALIDNHYPRKSVN